tara:strand:- start:65 stop:421 length:357 start_codon:yes stop_codon:yes gene_type:complete
LAADIIDFNGVHSLFQKKKKQEQDRVQQHRDEYEYKDEAHIPVDLPLAQLASIAQTFDMTETVKRVVEPNDVAFIALMHLKDCVDMGMVHLKMDADGEGYSINFTEPTKKPKRKKASK